MAQEILSIDNLGDLSNGAARLMIDREIYKAVADLYDRGNEDGKPRIVSINLEITLKGDIVLAAVRCGVKLPPMQSGNTVAEVRRRGNEDVLLFQTLNADRVDQNTFQEFEPKEGE